MPSGVAAWFSFKSPILPGTFLPPLFSESVKTLAVRACVRVCVCVCVWGGGCVQGIEFWSVCALTLQAV